MTAATSARRLRRHFRSGAAGVLLALTSATALADAFPAKPVRIIVPFAAGGSSDVMTRQVAAELGERVGQPFVVENRGGAAGNLGMEAGARATPDGYTITMVAQTLAANPFLYKMPFDVVKDFAPVTLMVIYHQVLVVNNSVPAKSVGELIAVAKARPDTLTFGTSGAGGASHLAAEMLMNLTSTRLVHVPYKGVGPAMNDLLGGQISMMFDILSGAAPHIRAGKIRALGVSTLKRSALFPDVPPIADTVPGFEMSGWLGIAAPAATPPDRIAFLSKEFTSVLRSPQVTQRLTEAGYEVVGSTPEQFAKLIQTDLQKYEKLIKGAGIKLQ